MARRAQKKTDDPSRLDRNSVLIAAGELVKREVELDTLLKQLIDSVTEAMEADRGTLYLVDKHAGELVSKVAHLPEIKEIRLKLGQGLAGYVASTGAVVNTPHSPLDPRFYKAIDEKTGYETRTVLAVPVKDRRGETLGVIQVLNKRDDVFGADDELLLKALAGQVAMVLESTSLYGELRSTGNVPLAYRYNGIVGVSDAMQGVYDIVGKAAATDATVLITGDTGTGKGLLARAIHYNSNRREEPFINVDCAALPGSLIENELFGHEKGAYTGAERQTAGKFEIADGGTIFLDEVGELPLALQGKLLRVIQDKAFERVGGTDTLQVDVRIVAATNRNLEELVARGEFREDLYYRLRVVRIRMPTLRERGREDMERLAFHFLGQFARRHGKPVDKISDAAMTRLANHSWPGNVRELENCIEGAVVLASGDTLEPGDLPLPTGGSPLHSAPVSDDLASLTWDQMEERYIGAVLKLHEGNRTAAARAMGIGRNTLLRKIKEYGLS